MRQGPFSTQTPLVLASASPRRQFLLASQGLSFQVIPYTGKEPSPIPEESPRAYALRTARSKGQQIASTHPENLVLSADTIVVCAHEILGKPRDAEHAIRILQRLQGAWHKVITAFCLYQDARLVHEQAVHTRVHMRVCSDAVIRAYVATNEPLDKAGAYGIQGQGAFLVDQINGSYTNVVGLPLTEVVEILLSLRGIRPAENNMGVKNL